MYSIGLEEENIWVDIEDQAGYFNTFHLTMPELIYYYPLLEWEAVAAVPEFEAEN